MLKQAFASLAVVALSTVAHGAVIADFETSLQPFASAPTNGAGVPTSGSTLKISGPSTLTADTTTAISGLRSEKFTLGVTADATTAAPAVLRHLSGGGTNSNVNNATITTTSGVDGWIGFYVKTTSPGWTAQIWMEADDVAPIAAGNNNSVQKAIPADGEWHLLEWNLDDTSAGPDGWGTSGILAGVTTVADGNHSIDSFVFRNFTALNASSHALNIDFFAINPAGSVALLVPEPTLAAAALPALALLRRNRRK